MPNENDDGFVLSEPRGDGVQESLLMRLIWMIVIWIMISMAQTVLGLATLLQFVIMLTNKRKPNEQLADFGTSLGIWVAKAARYQTAASEVKPWPWSELD